MELANNEKLRQKIEQKIDEISNFYDNNKGIIITETDLQCILYGKLLEVSELSELKTTADAKEKILTHYVHTEISWYDDYGKLCMRPDISLIKPSSLTVKGKRDFEFDGDDCIIFELKINRVGSANKFLEQLKGDMEKFDNLKKQEGNENIYCYFVALNQRNITNKELEEFIRLNKNGKQHKIIYINGNL